MTLSRTIAQLIVQKNLPAQAGLTIDDVVETLRTYNLLSLLPSIKEAVLQSMRARKQEEAIHVESPFEIGSAALHKIKRIVGDDLAQTEVIINKDILAGFKARYKGKLYDGSAQRIIKQLISTN
jgi:F0F1-type ATP synthase delta subunit